MAPQWPLLPGFHTLVSLCLVLVKNWSVWPAAYSPSNGISLPKLDYQKTMASVLSTLFLLHKSLPLALRKTRYHVMEMLHGKKWGLQSTEHHELKSTEKPYVWVWKQIFQSQLSLMGDIESETPAKILLDSWHTETRRK